MSNGDTRTRNWIRDTILPMALAAVVFGGGGFIGGARQVSAPEHIPADEQPATKGDLDMLEERLRQLENTIADSNGAMRERLAAMTRELDRLSKLID